MKNNNKILEEGYRNIGISFGISLFLLLFISDCLGYIGLLISLFIVFVYRNSKKHIFINSQNILAPIDATVTAIDTVNGKTKVYCKVNLCNNHIFRAPQDSEMKIKKYKRGLNLNPNSHKASMYNEQITLKFDDMKVKLISGLCNNRIKKMNDSTVVQGDKLAVFLDGLVVITFAAENKYLVSIGDKLSSGQTVLFKK